MRNRNGEKRDWLRGDAFEAWLRRLVHGAPSARTPNPAERRSEAESENVIVLKPLAAATATLAGESSI